MLDLSIEHEPRADCDIPERCRGCPIRRDGFCRVLSARDVNTLSRIAHHRTLKPGQTVMRYEEKPVYWAAVSSGVLKMTKLLADGRQQIVDLLFPSDFVGRLFAAHNPYFVEAVTNTELCCFRVADFEAMLQDRPEMKQQLFEQTLAKLDAAHDWLMVLGKKTAEERVASLLYVMVTRAPIAEACSNVRDRVPRFDINMKREEMATFLGLTYETVIRQLRSLNDRGIIALIGRRRFQVPDLQALRLAAG